jgi:hypothetical protein
MCAKVAFKCEKPFPGDFWDLLSVSDSWDAPKKFKMSYVLSTRHILSCFAACTPGQQGPPFSVRVNFGFGKRKPLYSSCESTL